MITALFDLDGVILDTETQYTKFWTQIGRRYFPENVNFAQEIKGRVMKDIGAIYFPNPDLFAKVYKELNDFEAGMKYPFIAGVKSFVQQLQEAGVKSAVVTSSDQAKMENVYREYADFRNLFTRILTAEDFSRPKPYPDCYLQAAKVLNASIEDCVVFEDSVNGLKAARSANMFVVGLSTTLPREEVCKYANYVIPDFSNLSLEEIEKMSSHA